MQSGALSPLDGSMAVPQLPNLETFSKAAELSCFTAAGRALGLTQAAVSQRIQVLEQVVGVSLFRRRGGRVLLTEAGQRLYPFAQRILALHQEARREVTGQKPIVGGELTLAASSIPGEHLLPGFLSGFRERHPHIQVRVTVTDTKAVLRQVEQGQAQLGLVGGKSDSPHLEFRSFACDKMVLVVPAKHPLSRRRQVSLRQLSQLPLIVRETGSGSRWCLEEALERVDRSLKECRVTLEMGSNEAIKEAILRGLGVAVLSTHVVEKELEAGELHALRVSGLPLKRDLFVVWDRRRVLPIPARLFLDFLQPDLGPKIGP
jgi:DNA-binding transcriptional LysR family regulator